MWGRVRHGLCMLYVEVCLRAWVVWVVLSALDMLDGEGHVYRVRAIFGQELRHMVLAREFVQEARNPERILVRCGWHIIDRPLKPAQFCRRYFINIATRQCPREISWRRICGFSDRAPPSVCLKVRVVAKYVVGMMVRKWSCSTAGSAYRLDGE